MNLAKQLLVHSVWIACLSGSAPMMRAQDASSVWRKVLKKCAKTDAIGKESLFFGMSNTVGPGSVWRLANDKSIRLLFELSDAFPNENDRLILVKNNNASTCSGDSSTGGI